MAFADIDGADGGRRWRQHFFPLLSLLRGELLMQSDDAFSPSPASVEDCARPRRGKMGRARAASPISPTLPAAIKDTEAAGSSTLADDP